MPMFKVRMRRDVIYYASMTVEAKDEDDAIDVAETSWCENDTDLEWGDEDEDVSAVRATEIK